MKYFLWTYRVIIAIVLIVALVIGLSHVLHPPSKVQEVTPKQLHDTQQLAKAVNVPTKTAAQIQREIVRVREPAEEYYASNTQAVKQHEEVQRKQNKADRVIVTPNEEEKKVDVYRISLRKEHKVKAGITVEGGRAYPAIGYQAGRFEGVATIDGNHIKSATVMYTVAEW